MKRIQAIESIAHVAMPHQFNRPAGMDDLDDCTSPWDAMQDAAELEQLRAVRQGPRRMRFQY